MDSKIEFNELCRLCLARKHVNIHIFEGEGCKEGIFLKISTCLPVNISLEDKLPKRICSNCFGKLNTLYQFYNKSVNSEKQLLEWYNECATENDNETFTDNRDTEMSLDDSEVEVKEEELSFLPEEHNNYNIKLEEVNVQDSSHQVNEMSHEECSDTIESNAVTNGEVDTLKSENDKDGSSVTSNPLRTEIKSRYTKMPSRRKSKSQEVIVKQKSKRKFFKYTEKDLVMALLEIREGRKSIREASKKFGVPKTTLQDRLKGRAQNWDKIGKPGPEPILTIKGEKRIADWVAAIGKRGFHIQKRYVMETVQKIVKESDRKKDKVFKNGKPGQKWYANFLKRNPEISMRENENIKKYKTPAIGIEESIRVWFADLRNFLEENNLMDVFDDPNRILNGDEFGLSLCPKTGQVLGPKEYRNLNTIKIGNEKENITVLIVFTASGKICPPLVVFPNVRLPKVVVVESTPEFCVLGKSNSGGMEADLFYDYIVNDLNNWLTKNLIKKPVILFIDGHRSHITLPLSEVCEKNQIILYALPSKIIHILQPADVSVFRPFKEGWKDTVQNWQSKPENINSLITNLKLCRLIKEVLAVPDMKNSITNGFLKCGLFPLDPNNIDYTNCVKNKYIGKTK